jgi:hypothetical protein
VSQNEVNQTENNQNYPITGKKEKEVMPKGALSGEIGEVEKTFSVNES